MSSRITPAPQAEIQNLNITQNEYGEMLISAEDLAGNDIGRSGGLPMPNGPFALLYNPNNKDWITAKMSEFSNGYQFVEVIIGA